MHCVFEYGNFITVVFLSNRYVLFFSENDTKNETGNALSEDGETPGSCEKASKAQASR